ncbi:MAG: 16S rRNA (adenine(1518)-N(6)/adenine(1519)-N(6))-dimethyltransferase RsmA [Coriobacteriaceae bacterium]|jgi:16S rRNA (adenine1518-N6/adenine1519-N6)-dimethyltransferase|nr:16S rRNA (adenine(1518)-N(6)/adenine(1519)-N(6))-dimethyltransferase RsmA [Coriobacteriaceae bacterium]
MDKLSPLASVAQTRMVLEEHGLRTKKALGQHFLINDGVVSRICALADVGPADTVCEIGPGIGTLTLGLLRKGAKVVAIERDADMQAVLARTTADYTGSFALINKDAREVDDEDLKLALASLNTLPPLPTKLVANLPYAVAATLVLDFFERFPALRSATVMVQREVADRMAAQPRTKAYGAYTVKLQLYAKAAGRFMVGPANFFPPPRVESVVLRLDRHELRDNAGALVTPAIREAASLMADAAFANRRKTLMNSCKAYLAAGDKPRCPFSASTLPGLFKDAGISPEVRGEALSLQDFLSLGRSLQRLQEPVRP